MLAARPPTKARQAICRFRTPTLAPGHGRQAPIFGFASRRRWALLTVIARQLNGQVMEWNARFDGALQGALLVDYITVSPHVAHQHDYRGLYGYSSSTASWRTSIGPGAPFDFNQAMIRQMQGAGFIRSTACYFASWAGAGKMAAEPTGTPSALAFTRAPRSPDDRFSARLPSGSLQKRRSSSLGSGARAAH